MRLGVIVTGKGEAPQSQRQSVPCRTLRETQGTPYPTPSRAAFPGGSLRSSMLIQPHLNCPMHFATGPPTSHSFRFRSHMHNAQCAPSFCAFVRTVVAPLRMLVAGKLVPVHTSDISNRGSETVEMNHTAPGSDTAQELLRPWRESKCTPGRAFTNNGEI